jgi:ABC-2 type transport system permease protein
MMLTLHKIAAFVTRDAAEASSYRFAFAMQYARAALTVLVFYFVSGLVEGRSSPHLAPYGGNYFAFVLVGIAITEYLRGCLNDFAYAIRNAQVTGTIEALLVTQTSLPTIVLASSVYGFLSTSARVLLYLGVGIALFGVDVSRADVPTAFLVLLLSIAGFSSLGVAAASMTILFKRGETCTAALLQVSLLLGGVFYPVTVLPTWLQTLSALLPLTYSLRAMRQALFRPDEVNASAGDLAFLALFAGIALPLSMWIFGRAVHHAKATGSLGHY